MKVVIAPEVQVRGPALVVPALLTAPMMPDPSRDNGRRGREKPERKEKRRTSGRPEERERGKWRWDGNDDY